METPPKESDKTPQIESDKTLIVLGLKKKSGRKKKDQKVKFHIVNTPIVLEFK